MAVGWPMKTSAATTRVNIVANATSRYRTSTRATGG